MRKLLFKFATQIWWPFWSNFRHRKATRFFPYIEDIDIINNLDNAKFQVMKLYRHFEWTADDWTQLFDCIQPPTQCYVDYKAGYLKDDCDGFHALVHYCLYYSNIESYLLTVNTKKFKDGHCVLLFKLNDKWYINDYDTIYEGFTTARKAIDNYNEIFPELYKCKYKVIYNGLLKYDFNKGKFKGVNINSLN